MSMIVVLVKVSPRLHAAIVADDAALLRPLLAGTLAYAGFDRARDVCDDIDYRDLVAAVADEDDPVFALFAGEPLVAGYEWTYGAPGYFDVAALTRLHADIEASFPLWPVTDLLAFLAAALAEGKGVIAGVA